MFCSSVALFLRFIVCGHKGMHDGGLVGPTAAYACATSSLSRTVVFAASPGREQIQRPKTIELGAGLCRLLLTRLVQVSGELFSISLFIYA